MSTKKVKEIWVHKDYLEPGKHKRIEAWTEPTQPFPAYDNKGQQLPVTQRDKDWAENNTKETLQRFVLAVAPYEDTPCGHGRDADINQLLLAIEKAGKNQTSQTISPEEWKAVCLAYAAWTGGLTAFSSKKDTN